ncbi:50S ribosomal protein L5 [bacterium]
MARLLEFYNKQVTKELKEKYKLKNIMQVPRMEKIVINMGIGDAKDDAKVIEIVAEEMASMTGQKPVITRAKKSISNFKIREGMPVGCMVTLRGIRMYEFMDRLISLAIPRIRDFTGLNPNSFDNNANYNFGLSEQHIFPEVNIEKSDRVRGMNITFVVSTKNKDMARDLLMFLGMPLKGKTKKSA